MSVRIAMLLAASFVSSALPFAASRPTVRPCAWLSQGRLAYVDHVGLVICSARAAVRLTPTTDVREVVWSADGTRLHFVVVVVVVVVAGGSERHLAFDVRTRGIVRLADDCDFVAFAWCERYRGEDGTVLWISRPPRRAGGMSSAPEVATLHDGSRVFEAAVRCPTSSCR